MAKKVYRFERRLVLQIHLALPLHVAHRNFCKPPANEAPLGPLTPNIVRILKKENTSLSLDYYSSG